VAKLVQFKNGKYGILKDEHALTKEFLDTKDKCWWAAKTNIETFCMFDSAEEATEHYQPTSTEYEIIKEL
jgi:hypothetical protein